MSKFVHLGINNNLIFIPFVPLGFPNREISFSIIQTLIQAKVDMLELGFPFSDPVGDGSILEQANVDALKSGIHTDICFEMLQDIRKMTTTPIGLLLYYNLIYQYGVKEFVRRCQVVGVGTILVADLPLEEADELLEALELFGLKSVFIVSEFTPPDRLIEIVPKTTGYIYLVSQPGVTGVKDNVNSAIPVLKRLEQSTSLPICVGFGVSTPTQVSQLVQAGADGVISGSAIAKIIYNNIKFDKNGQSTPLPSLHKEVSNFINRMQAGLTID